MPNASNTRNPSEYPFELKIPNQRIVVRDSDTRSQFCQHVTGTECGVGFAFLVRSFLRKIERVALSIAAYFLFRLTHRCGRNQNCLTNNLDQSDQGAGFLTHRCGLNFSIRSAGSGPESLAEILDSTCPIFLIPGIIVLTAG